MRRFITCVLVVFAILNCSCGLFVAERMMDKMTQMMEKMAELQLKIEKEKRAQIHTVEGVVLKVETLTVEREMEAAKEMKKELESDKNIKINTKRTYKVYNVVFTDGREKEFSTVPAKPLESGVAYIITYNGMNEIVEIKKVQP